MSSRSVFDFSAIVATLSELSNESRPALAPSGAPRKDAAKGQFPKAFQADLGRPVTGTKIFRLTCRANHWFNFACLTADEGRLAIVTNVAVRCGGRESSRQTNVADADGEVVWSWRPDAGVKLAMMLRITPMTVAKEPGHRGEREVSRKPSRGESRQSSG
jgi:hypothetical protein